MSPSRLFLSAYPLKSALLLSMLCGCGATAPPSRAETALRPAVGPTGSSGAPVRATRLEDPKRTTSAPTSPGARHEQLTTTAGSTPPAWQELTPDQWQVDDARNLALEALSPSGSWVAYCTEDGAMYLATSPREGTASLPRHIEQVLRWSPDGERLVVLDRGRPVLVDLAAQREFDLSGYRPDLSADAWPDHRAFAFSSDGKLLAFLTQASPSTLTWLDLSGHGDSEPPSRSVALTETPWRLDVTGSSAVLDGLGARWPVPKVPSPRSRCKARPSAYSAYGALSEPMARFRRRAALVDLTKGRAPEEAPGFVMALASGWVRREGSGRLLWVQGRTQRQIASSRCGGRIRHASMKSGLFVVSCEHFVPEPAPAPKSGKDRKAKPEFRFETFLLAPGYVQELSLELPRIGVDRLPEEGPSAELVPLSDGGQTILVDLTTRTRTILDPEMRVLSVSGARALALAHGKVVTMGRLPNGTMRPLDQVPSLTVDPLGQTLVAGGFVLIGDTLLHPLLPPSSIPATPLALTPLGAVLSGAPGDDEHTMRGPLVVTRARLAM